MKWFHILLLCAALLPFTACQQHKVSELSLIEESPEPANKAEAKQSVETEKAKDSGPAPQYFPTQSK